MKKHTLALTALTLTLLSGCIEDVTAPVNRDDIVNFDDILLENITTASGAAQVGDPAVYLGEASRAEAQLQGDLQGIFQTIQDITSVDPQVAGLADGHAFALWEGGDALVDYRFYATRAPNARVQYLLNVKPTDQEEFRSALAGVLVKSAPQRGGGRLYIDLSVISDLEDEEVGVDGAIYVAFANANEDVKGRRAVYADIVERGTDDEPIFFTSDLLVRNDETGRYRSIYASDFLEDVDGVEAMGMRLLWNVEGGRADVLFADVEEESVIGTAHECWDENGLRSAYLDSFEGNEAEDPDEGDVIQCGVYSIDEEGGDFDEETDPELDALLEANGANDVEDEEVDNAMEEPSLDEEGAL